ncbi:response regulator [Telmatobacter bradus]|uniref:Hpt domain-containing response regulator n=1 Tax=Telmatobacter bradus TaxID=474953 RepID=UPI003B434057
MPSSDAQSRLPLLLLVDDDPVSREVTMALLTMSGYKVYATESGASSLRMLEREGCAPDVILMDAQMPGLSGVELIAAYRERTQALVYVISASRPPAGVIGAADGLLVKPFTVEDLDHLLSRRKERVAADEPSPSASFVHSETLARLRERMPPRAVRELYQTVVSDLRERAVLIEKAIQRKDPTEVRRQGHAIKGGCGMAGAQEAAQIGARLEGIGNQLDDSLVLLEDLRTATQRLERMLESNLTI